MTIELEKIPNVSKLSIPAATAIPIRQYHPVSRNAIMQIMQEASQRFSILSLASPQDEREENKRALPN